MTTEAKAKRFLVLGCGSIGRRHMRNLLDLGAEIVAYDEDAGQRARAAAELGVPVVESLEQGWAAGVQVALICVPTHLHIGLALEAARRGLDFFVEKPVADRFDGLEELLALVREKQLITLVGCNMRFHPTLGKVRELVRSDAIGRVVAARVEAGQYLPDWRPATDYRQSYSASRAQGGGVILDSAVHEIDYLLWLLGDVERVSCFCGRISSLEIDTEDTAEILLRFAGGAIAEIHVDYVQRSYSRNCELIGEAGSIRWDYLSGEVRWYSARDAAWHTFPGPADLNPNIMYVEEMRHFLECLESRAQSTASVSAAVRVLEVALAAKRSAATARLVPLEPTMSRPTGIVAIVQARMGSTRLPGKVMQDLGGRPVLMRVVERAQAIPGVEQVVVATTHEPRDDVIERFFSMQGIPVYRGSEDDVLDRYYQAARLAGAKVVMRVTADCPFLDPFVSQRVLARFLEGGYDYVCNTQPPTYPDGLDTEVFSFAALERAWREATLPSEREHATPYIWKNPDKFRIANVVAERESAHMRWTVDRPEDLEFAREVYRHLRGNYLGGTEEILAVLEAHPGITGLNVALPRDEGYQKSLREDAATADGKS